MEQIIYNLYVQTLRAKLELCRLVAARLTEEMEIPFHNIREKRALFHRWIDVTRDGDTLEFQLELLRRHERESPLRT